MYKLNDYTDSVIVFKALSDENRLMILAMLDEGEMCACKILDNLKISQSTLSHHMKILCDAGIVTGRKEGKWTHYSVSKVGRTKVDKIFDNVLNIMDTDKIGDKKCRC